MKTIYASDFGIKDKKEIAAELTKLFKSVGATDGEKTVAFERGTYYIDSRKCEQHMMFITNTVGDMEFAENEVPHLNRAAFYLEKISDLTVDGNGSVFVIDGKASNAAIVKCKNITLKNIEIRHSNPDLHELRVVKKRMFSVDFAIDRESSYETERNNLIFYGDGYRTVNDKNAGWIGHIGKNSEDRLSRVLNPLFACVKVSDIGDRKIRVRYPNTHRFKKGDRYYIYDVRRQYVGIFIDGSEDITLENIKQRFNYSLAVVAQDSENITVDSVEFAPHEGSAKMMASLADFIQICMCRGRTVIKNSYFDGAGDDLLNIHGIHFKITDVNGKKITVRFMHPQTHGFNPLRAGDKIAYIDPKSLVETGEAYIESSVQTNEYELVLTVSDTTAAKVGAVIEDVSACSQLEFVNNFSTRIITRGLLITTREKVTVENNRFVSTAMSGILLSDDAESWYESGMCRDVTVRNNTFDCCGKTPVLIKPENRIYSGAVHKNVKILGNTFKKYDGVCIDAKATDGITVRGNSFANSKKIKTVNCNRVDAE